MSLPTWEDLDKISASYKTVGSHKIKCDILCPKGLEPGKHRVYIIWHAGALIYGSRSFRPFLPDWLPQLAAKQGAFILSPDYRLLPEASGRDVLADVSDFWGWLHEKSESDKAQSVLSEKFGKPLSFDLDDIVVTGGSAGGWIAAQMALDHPEGIRAVLLQYAMVDVDDEAYTKGKAEATPIMGVMPPPRHAVEETIRKVKPGAVVSDDCSDERYLLCLGAGTWGLHRRLLGGGEGLNPLRRVKQGTRLPPRIWLIHGTNDNAVPVQAGKDFEARVKECCKGTELRAEYFEGFDHGFEWRCSIERDVWLAEGLEWATAK